MVNFTKHVAMKKVTSSADSEEVVNRSNHMPFKWFSIYVDNDAYIGINADADSDSLLLRDGECYTTPEKVRIVKISVMRATTNNVTVRGSAWF